jgi:hypothetical protein
MKFLLPVLVPPQYTENSEIEEYAINIAELFIFGHVRPKILMSYDELVDLYLEQDENIKKDKNEITDKMLVDFYYDTYEEFIEIEDDDVYVEDDGIGDRVIGQYSEFRFKDISKYKLSNVLESLKEQDYCLNKFIADNSKSEICDRIINNRQLITFKNKKEFLKYLKNANQNKLLCILLVHK